MSRLENFSYNGKSIVREVFIETGTYEGESLRNAVGAGFSHLYSIEVSPKNFAKATENLSEFDNVNIILGSSIEVLPDIILPGRRTTFWLDAHFQGRLPGEEKDKRIGECPLIKELNLILSYEWAIPPIILIDDAHMFADQLGQDAKEAFDSKFDIKQWPRLKDIRKVFPAGWKVKVQDWIIYCTFNF